MIVSAKVGTTLKIVAYRGSHTLWSQVDKSGHRNCLGQHMPRRPIYVAPDAVVLERLQTALHPASCIVDRPNKNIFAPE